MRLRFAFALGLACGALPGSALAYCLSPSFRASEPSAPGSYSRPDVPFCLSTYSYSGKHTCDSWEIDAYRREVEEYIRDLARYAEEAVELANEARRFALDAEEYARCEAKEVAEQHE